MRRVDQGRSLFITIDQDNLPLSPLLFFQALVQLCITHRLHFP
jgi:hypothetical protein